LQIGFLKAKKAWNDLTRDFEESAEVQDKINKLTAENSKLTEENGKKVDNIVAVYEKAKNSVVKAANTIKKNTKEAFDNSGAILAAEKNLGRLQIAFQGIVEKYDRQAELQRQIRDDETKTIDERIKANEKLAEVLDEGQKKELENLDEQIAQQQIRLSNNKGNIQIENEILALQAEKTAVEAKYTGLKSEQMVNINGLNKEAIELKRAEMEGTIEANTIMANSDAEMLGDTLEGFRLKKQALQDEFMAKRKAIDDEIAANKEGTAAYVEAVNKKKVLDAQYAADVRTLTKEQQEYIKAAAEKEKETNQAVQDAKMASVMGALAGVQALLGADSKYGKALSVAQAIISTYQGASKALGQGGVFGPVAAAGVIAQGLAQVRSIMSTDLPEAPMGGGGGGGMSMPSGPSVGIIQGQMSQTSQLQAELNSQMRRPTRAYVVGQNVTTQQSLDRHILENATL
jgi:chromosome segregation ATPase